MDRHFRAIAAKVIPQRKQQLPQIARHHAQALADAILQTATNTERRTAVNNATAFLDGLVPGDRHIPALANQLLATAAQTNPPVADLENLYTVCLDSTANLAPPERYAVLDAIFRQVEQHPAGPLAVSTDLNLRILAALRDVRNSTTQTSSPTTADIQANMRHMGFAQNLMDGYTVGDSTRPVRPRIPPTPEQALKLFDAFLQIFPHGPQNDQTRSNTDLMHELVRKMPQSVRPQARTQILPDVSLDQLLCL